MPITRRLLLALALPFAGLLPACGWTEASEHLDPKGSDTAPSIVCTTAMVGDLVRAIAGPDAEVTTMFGPDVDPHMFRPTRDDVALLTSASLVFTNGLGLEGYLAATLERVADSGTRVIAIAESITEPQELLLEAENIPDPHLWMDVELWSRATGVIAEAVGTDAAIERAEDLAANLLELDAEIEAQLAGIPEGGRLLVTAHDAFSYFGRRYGIEVHAVQGVSTASEAGLRAIEDLVDLMVERGVPAIFFESSVSDRNVKALVEGAAARDHEVIIGGVLHSDAPGEARTYAAMMRHNAHTIAKSLSASAAAR